MKIQNHEASFHGTFIKRHDLAYNGIYNGAY